MKKSAEIPTSFETAVQALETLVNRMESGQLPLEESLAAYQKGVELLCYCQKALRDTEQQIRILDEQGNLRLFDND